MEWKAGIPESFDMHLFKLCFDDINWKYVSGRILSGYTELEVRFSNYEGLFFAFNVMLDALQYPSSGTLADYKAQAQRIFIPKLSHCELSQRDGKIGNAYVYVHSRNHGEFAGRLLSLYKDCRGSGKELGNTRKLCRYCAKDFANTKELNWYIWYILTDNNEWNAKMRIV